MTPTPINTEELFAKALEQWGIEAQVATTMEECGELIAVLNRYFFRRNAAIEDLAGEIADVEIMCAQLRYLIGSLGSVIVDRIKGEKLGRLAERLGHE